VQHNIIRQRVIDVKNPRYYRVDFAGHFVAGFVFRNFLAFSVIVVAFFGAAIWECQRLFKKPLPLLMAAGWAAFFAYLLFHLDSFSTPLLFALCVAFWLLRLVPLLAKGLPPEFGFSNGILSTLYGIVIFGCFIAIAVLFKVSPLSALRHGDSLGRGYWSVFFRKSIWET
jgi:hypothetical protein